MLGQVKSWFSDRPPSGQSAGEPQINYQLDLSRVDLTGRDAATLRFAEAVINALQASRQLQEADFTVLKRGNFATAGAHVIKITPEQGIPLVAKSFFSDGLRLRELKGYELLAGATAETGFKTPRIILTDVPRFPIPTLVMESVAGENLSTLLRGGGTGRLLSEEFLTEALYRLGASLAVFHQETAEKEFRVSPTAEESFVRSTMMIERLDAHRLSDRDPQLFHQLSGLSRFLYDRVRDKSEVSLGSVAHLDLKADNILACPTLNRLTLIDPVHTPSSVNRDGRAVGAPEHDLASLELSVRDSLAARFSAVTAAHLAQRLLDGYTSVRPICPQSLDLYRFRRVLGYLCRGEFHVDEISLPLNEVIEEISSRCRGENTARLSIPEPTIFGGLAFESPRPLNTHEAIFVRRGFLDSAQLLERLEAEKELSDYNTALLKRILALDREPLSCFSNTAAELWYREKPAEESIQIAIPAFGGVDTAWRCLESIALQQDAPPIHTVVVMDGHDEQLQELFLNFMDEHSMAVTLLVMPHIGSSTLARNVALMPQLGSFVGFMDIDDFFSSSAVLGTLSREFTQNSSLRAVSGCYDYLNERGETFPSRSLSTEAPNSPTLRERGQLTWANLLIGNVPLAVRAFLVKREACPKFPYYEAMDDLGWLARLLASEGPKIESVKQIPLVVFTYYQNPLGLERRHAEDSHIKMIHTGKAVADLFEAAPATETAGRSAQGLLAEVLVRRLLKNRDTSSRLNIMANSPASGIRFGKAESTIMVRLLERLHNISAR